MPPAALRLLPGSSLQFGPPRRTASWAQIRRDKHIVWRQLAPERVDFCPPPFTCNDRSNPLADGRRIVWPETGVADIPGARLLDENAWVVGPGDRFLADFCYVGPSRHSRGYHLTTLNEPRRLPGTTLNLCSAHSAHNFFHFAIDAIARAELVERAGFTWEDFDHIVLPRLKSRMTDEILANLGVPAGKVVHLKWRDHVWCDRLIQPSFPGPLACTPRWVFEFYRRWFPVVSGERGRRLYFPRRGDRHPSNESEIAAMLKSRGVEAVDPLTTPNLRELLATASHVVGVHGAGLANLVFCAPGTRVLELMPSDIAAHYNRWFYYSLCHSGDLPYGVVIGKSQRRRLTSFSPQSPGPFEIPLDDLERGLEALLRP